MKHTMNRRMMLRTLGMMAGLPLVSKVPLLGQAGCAVLSSPSLTEGPYFVDEELNRSDIREDRGGIPLVLRVNVGKLVECGTKPLAGAYVDIWHCDAAGVYSDVAAQNSVGKRFLRGYQATDRKGNVEFTTVYPGWYPGRAVHIHAKVRMFDGESQSYEFTSQFFFDEDFTDLVYREGVYGQRTARRDTLNTGDGIYRGASSLGGVTSDAGSHLMLKLGREGEAVVGEAKLLCDLSLGSSPDGTGQGGAGGPGGPGMPPGPPPV